MWTPDPAIIVTAEQKAVEHAAAMLASFSGAVQAHLDATAQARSYDNAISIATYRGSSIPQWEAEAEAFVAWRDSVWAYALAELEKVQNGQRSQPTIDGFIAELPVLVWPE